MEKTNLTNLMRKFAQRAFHCAPPFLSPKSYPFIGPVVLESLRTLWHRKEQATAVSIVTGIAFCLWRKWKAVLSGEKAKRKLQKAYTDTRTSIARVDVIFLRRLFHLLRILYPSLRSKESLVTSLLTVLLLARTLLSLKIAEAMGYNAKCLVQRKLDQFIFGVISLGIVAIPTVIVNSGVSYFTQVLSLLYRRRLSRHVHKLYLSDLAFYKANFEGNLDNMYVIASCWRQQKSTTATATATTTNPNFRPCPVTNAWHRTLSVSRLTWPTSTVICSSQSRIWPSLLPRHG